MGTTIMEHGFLVAPPGFWREQLVTRQVKVLKVCIHLKPKSLEHFVYIHVCTCTCIHMYIHVCTCTLSSFTNREK